MFKQMDKNDDDLSFEGITTSTLQQDVHCGLFLDENDKSIEVFITVKYKTHNCFHVNSFYYVTQNSMSNFVVVDNITLMTQFGTLFFITKQVILFYLTNK